MSDNNQFNNFEENDNFIELPKPNNQPQIQKNNIENIYGNLNNEVQKPKPIIEIPQEYYDKLAKEEQEKIESEKLAEEKIIEKNRIKSENNKIFGLILLNAILIFALLYLTLNISEFFILAIPSYMILLSIFHAIKYKTKSDVPISIMVGGIVVGVITFILSMVKTDQIDLWTYYAVASAITGFIGLITTNIITKIIGDNKNIKALQTIGYLIYFASLIGLPIYFYKNYPEEFYKIIFQKQTEVVAETEKEFVLKTLKNRYNVEFTCDAEKERHQIDQNKRKIVERECTDNLGNSAIIQSIVYNESKNEYIVTDNYIDILYLNKVKEKISTDLASINNSDVNISLYPEKNCTFVGDCVNCEEYYNTYDQEINIDNQYKNSTHLNMTKYLNYSEKDFINNYNFKFIIDITGAFPEETTDYNLVIDNTLKAINNLGYKNNYGYIITLNNNVSNGGFQLEKTVYKVKGNTTDDKTFKNPIVIE